MTPEFFWAVGIFEGEGCISWNKAQNVRYPKLYLAMTDKDIIDRFDAVFPGSRYVRESKRTYADGTPHKTQYIWQRNKRSLIVEFLEQTLPYLGERRAFRALNALDYYDFNLHYSR